jgi:Xaa-Pro dipeptidase
VTPTRDPWFERSEFEARLGRARAVMRERDVDVLLAVHPMSVTYLTGYFSTAYLLFSLAIVPVDDGAEPLTVYRDNERFWFRRIGAFEPAFEWEDGEAPADVAARALRQAGAASARIGYEGSWPLNEKLLAAIQAALPNATFVDLGDDVIARLREIKSPAELELIRAAGRAVVAGTEAGIDAARAGISEREVAAAISSALIRAGSDVAGPGPMGSGERAAHLHARYEDRVMEPGDTLVLEVDGCVKEYFARFFRVVKIGRATDDERALADRLLRLQERAWAEVGDGAPVNVPDRIIREGIEAEGIARYTNNTFSSIGLTLFPPQRSALVVRGSDWRFEAGQAFHSYVKVGAFMFSETIAVTSTGYERLTTHPRELVVTAS